ncbi:hypothetical protein H4R33_002561 [Dimargaris cristalligena]|uniref:pH-response regulator protein palC n=1 Tax=Dimargaris cristalligena TaxID=215637 RepID=A0A4P9ZYU7_9FUNG|nr:hypothetical protein H4R33_002561 [Dimargaris cristalligena]RKP38857.1 BRO1-like domain-containing protein [Dimargaris cristalligena]|eukprot:RKP38857.1 BRO1-like domain-containing protein [Dimargaris cristalligena]
MHFYLLTPKTKSASFLRIFRVKGDNPEDTRVIHPLSEATAHRERMREALRVYRQGPQSTPNPADVSKLVASIEAYLPHLFWCVNYYEQSRLDQAGRNGGGGSSSSSSNGRSKTPTASSVIDCEDFGMTVSSDEELEDPSSEGGNGGGPTPGFLDPDQFVHHHHQQQQQQQHQQPPPTVRGGSFSSSRSTRMLQAIGVGRSSTSSAAPTYTASPVSSTVPTGGPDTGSTEMFIWKSPLLSGLDDSTRLGQWANKLKRGKFASNSVYFETAFTLLAYGLALSTLAFRMVDALTISERDRVIAEGDIKKFKQAMLYLSQAAGIHDYILENILPKWKYNDATHRPPDLTPGMLRILSKLALADAQRIAIRVSMPQKTSPGLVAKLLIGVAEEYDIIFGLFQAQHSDDVKVMTTELRRYIKDGRTFLLGCAKRYLALDAHNGDHNGVAVGFAQLAMQDLETLVKKSSGGRWAIAVEATKSLKEVKDEWLLYNKLNSTVTFESIPNEAELNQRIPGGRTLLKMKVFIPIALDRNAGSQFSETSTSTEKKYALQHEYY